MLERFALRVSETNVHWALQLIWTVYANLEENRPERLHGRVTTRRRGGAAACVPGRLGAYGFGGWLFHVLPPPLRSQ